MDSDSLFCTLEWEMAAFLDQLMQLLSFTEVWERKFASVVGTLMSFWKALGPVVRLGTRHFYALIHTVEQQWDYVLQLSDDVVSKIGF